jgi:pseudouridine synthase
MKSSNKKPARSKQGMERLNKVLSRAGVASRRGADRLIEEGRVTVNGETVGKLGLQIDPRRDVVKVDGVRIPPIPERHTYLMLNKPRGYVTTMSDPEGRPTVKDLLRGIKAPVYPVGRLDFNSEGLLLLTDDGDLARDLMHPRSKVAKTYAVKVRGTPSNDALGRLSRGIRLEGRKTMPARLSISRRGPNSWLQVTIFEGRKHQVKKMLQAIGHPVVKLRRVSYAGLDLGDLQVGRLRPLSRQQVERLRRAVSSRGKGGGGGPGKGARPA